MPVMKYLKRIFILFLIIYYNLSLTEANYPISNCGYTISVPGYYYLTRNLTLTSNAPCITITTNNVIIDGRGFSTIKNTSGSNVGGIVYIRSIGTSDAIINNITIRNISFYNFNEGHGSIKILAQSWYSSYINNVTIENVSFFNSIITIYVDYDAYYRFGFIENISFSNINATSSHFEINGMVIDEIHCIDEECYDFIFEYRDAVFIRNVRFSNFNISNSKIYLRAAVFDNINFSNFRILNSIEAAIYIDDSALSNYPPADYKRYDVNPSLKNINFRVFNISSSTNAITTYAYISNMSFSDFFITNSSVLFSNEIFDVFISNFTIYNSSAVIRTSRFYRTNLSNITLYNSRILEAYSIYHNNFRDFNIYSSSNVFSSYPYPIYMADFRNNNIFNFYIENSNNIFSIRIPMTFGYNTFNNITLRNSMNFAYLQLEGYSGRYCENSNDNYFTNFYLENSYNILYGSGYCQTLYQNFYNYVFENITVIRSGILNWQTGNIARNWKFRNIRIENSSSVILGAYSFDSFVFENIYIFNSSRMICNDNCDLINFIFRNITINASTDYVISSLRTVYSNIFNDIKIYNSARAIFFNSSNISNNSFSNIYIYNSTNALVLVRGQINRFSNISIINSPLAIAIFR